MLLICNKVRFICFWLYFTLSPYWFHSPPPPPVLCSLWDLSSPTRDWTWALGESTESWLLDCQGIPKSLLILSLGIWNIYVVLKVWADYQLLTTRLFRLSPIIYLLFWVGWGRHRNLAAVNLDKKKRYILLTWTVSLIPSKFQWWN